MSFMGEVACNDGLDGLPLHIFLWIAGRASAITPREVQVFLRMLDHSGWCQSRWARDNLYRTHERYAASWGVEALSRMTRDLEALQLGLRRLREVVTLAEATSVRADLLRLAEATARASTGLLGHASLRREQRDALLVFAALSEALLLAPDDRVRPAPRPTVVTGRSPLRAEPNPVTKARHPLRCVQVIDETPDIKTFRLAFLSDTRLSYHPGQFASVEIVDGAETLRRSYTIASSPSRPNVIELTIKRVQQGRVSNWLHDNLKVGDRIAISGPMGRFSCELEQTNDKLLFISAGSGITPVMSMSRYLHDTADPRDVVFLYSARTEQDLVFRDELHFIANRNPHFRPVFTLTGAGSQSWRGLTGRISATSLEDAAPDFRERTVFLCGPSAFMETVRRELISADFPMANFHAESFGGSRPPRAATPSGVGLDADAGPPPATGRKTRPSGLLDILPAPRLVLVRAGTAAVRAAAEVTPGPAPAGPSAPPAAAVVFSASGRETNARASETILEAAEGLGLPIPSACRVGVCGTCKTRKLSGTVSMDCEDGLDPGDRSGGFILACTARPVDRVTVEA